MEAIEITLLAVSTLAEIGVAWVIYYEIEGGRLDQFLSDADTSVRDRRSIYEAFCAISNLPIKERANVFHKSLESPGGEDLVEACNQTIRLVSRIGARLPRIWWLKRTPTDWHVAALLWMVLGPYIEKRRDESGPSYAESFLKYALASNKRLLKEKRDFWMIRDPNRSRKNDITFTRAEMLAAQMALKKALKQKG